MSGVNIPAANLLAPRVSLVSSSQIIDIPGDRWWGGIEYLPLSAYAAGFLYENCESDEKDKAPKLGSERSRPFAIVASDRCSTFGSAGIDFVARAKQKLSVLEPWWLERELWEGNIAGHPSFDGSDSFNLGSGGSVVEAFAEIDGTVASDHSDGRGMLHMGTQTFAQLFEYSFLRREGNVWFSPNDNVVVPGRGYPEEGTIYGHTGILQIVRSDIFVIGEDKIEMNRGNNDIEVWAERVYAYIFTNGSPVRDEESGDPSETDAQGEPTFYTTSIPV